MGKVIGIDPGVVTGVAVYEGGILTTFSETMFKAMKFVESAPEVDLVVVEDARQRKWYGKSTAAVLQGVGSVKTQCKQWEELLKEAGFNFEMVHPIKGGTKLNKKQFQKIWKGIELNLINNNEHSRDAAMLIHGRIKK